jgi:antitoxin MazE
MSENPDMGHTELGGNVSKTSFNSSFGDLQLESTARRPTMKIGKSGNGLTLRIPAAIVKALNLKPGDELQITVTGGQKFEVCKMEEPEPEADRVRRRLEALEMMRKMRIVLPDDYIFNRNEIYKL